MRINKLLGALGNINKIAEGIKNRIFKTDDVEMIAKMRWQECKVCPLLDKEGKSCAINSSGPCCSDCGCSIALKIRSLSSNCPKGRWKAIMPPNLEDELKKQIYFGHEAKKKHEKKLEKLRVEQKIKYEESKLKRDGSNI